MSYSEKEQVIKTAAHLDTTPMYDAEVSFDQDRSTNDLIIKRHQFIPDDVIASLKADKMDSYRKPAGEMLKMMSIPVALIEDLKREYNYDCMEEPISRTIKLLKALHLDAFITSDKQI